MEKIRVSPERIVIEKEIEEIGNQYFPGEKDHIKKGLAFDYLCGIQEMKKIFRKKRIYSEEEIIEIAGENNMVTVDCLKDDNQITVEPEGGDTVYEFSRLGEDKFILTWSEFDNS